MKQTLKLLMAAMLITANCAAASAQKSSNGQRISREEMAQKQARKEAEP